MSKVMDIIPDDTILEGNVLRQAIKEYQDAGFELPNPITGDEIKARLNAINLFSDGSTMLDTVNHILWTSIHRNELDELKPKNWKWQPKKEYTYGDFKAGLMFEVAYRYWNDKSKWTPEMYELERNMDEIFNSINNETSGTEKTTEKIYEKTVVSLIIKAMSSKETFDKK